MLSYRNLCSWLNRAELFIKRVGVFVLAINSTNNWPAFDTLVLTKTTARSRTHSVPETRCLWCLSVLLNSVRTNDIRTSALGEKLSLGYSPRPMPVCKKMKKIWNNNKISLEVNMRPYELIILSALPYLVLTFIRFLVCYSFMHVLYGAAEPS